MKLSPEIYDELNNISPLLAGIEKINVFSIPDGYFDLLSIDILKELNTNIPEFRNDKLTVPEGYFESLSTNILNKIRHIYIKHTLRFLPHSLTDLLKCYT